MPKIKRSSQGGFTLVELAIVIALSIMLAGVTLWPKIVQLRQQKATTQGTQLATLSNIVALFMTKNYGSLVAGTSVAGVANAYAPTITELRNWGLPSNFSTLNGYGGGYAVAITRTPGCAAPNCDLTSLVYLTNPILNPLTGRLDGSALGDAVRAMQSNVSPDAGWSTLAAPGTITGQNGQWSTPNPVGSVAGILAMRAGYGASGMAQFMRRDGTLPATGAQDMGGQDVNNVNTLRSATLVNSGNASIGGQASVAGQMTTNGITNTGSVNTNTLNVGGALTAGSATINGPASVNGPLNAATLTAGNTTINGTTTVNGPTNLTGTLVVGGGVTLASTLTVAGSTVTNGLSNNGNLKNTGDVETGRLYLTTIVAPGASCAGFTGYQAATSTGQIASCVNGVWAAYTPAPPPSPCNSTVVNWQGCSGSVPYTMSGNTASVAVTSGTGSATYSCNNGSWAFQSGTCTPPAADCAGKIISWQGSGSTWCAGTLSTLSSGSGQWVNSTGGGSGSVYATCTNGAISTTSPSCSPAASPPGSAGQTFSNPKTNDGKYYSANPTQRTQFCQNHGFSSSTGGTESNYGGSNMPVCWAIDGNNNCMSGGNCSTFAYSSPGCYVQNTITCQ